MNIAILGSGGREHAIAWKLQQSPKADSVVLLPGNGGTDKNQCIDTSDTELLKEYCKRNTIDLLVVGPEVPLAEGIVDAFKETGVKVFGPEKRAAVLESSKIFSKRFMKKYGVATADFTEFSQNDDPTELILKMDGNCVIKYSGLAAGKGVFVCSSADEANAAVKELKSRYGQSAEYIIEERLTGQEVSIIGFTDGTALSALLPSQDHKAAYDGDKGPNTGGMGAYCPAPAATETVLAAIDETIILPTLYGMEEEGFDYKGVVFFGIMLTEKGPMLLEYNVRFGDPETEVILPALKTDLLDVILSCFDGSLGDLELEFYDGYFVDVVLASGGYPGSYAKGKEIHGLEKVDKDCLVFHAGTKMQDGELLTSGGRVLNVVSHKDSLEAAIKAAYENVEKISFGDMYFRKDIGLKGLK